MEHLHNGFTLELCEGAFPLSTDSIALADFVRMPKNARILDLGAGCGTLGLMLCAKDSACSVTGVELDEAAHTMALHNALANQIGNRLTSICADLTTASVFLKPGSFHCCVSNPPYFRGGPKSKTVPTARREDTCSLDALFAAAAWSLRYGGDFFLVHRPERLAELCACAAAHRLEPKSLRLLRHREDGSITLILVQCRKGANPGLQIDEKCLHHRDGQPTAYYKEIYHL